MQWIDWCITIIPVTIVLGLAVYARRFVRGVADFLAAGRVAGRYVISVGDLEAGHHQHHEDRNQDPGVQLAAAHQMQIAVLTVLKCRARARDDVAHVMPRRKRVGPRRTGRGPRRWPDQFDFWRRTSMMLS